MYPLKTSTAITVPIFAHDANGDGVTGIADGSWTKRISKNGGAFAAMTVTITELENGWYAVPIDAGHTDTLGILSVSLSAGTCKRVNVQVRIHARLPDDLAYPAVSGRSIDVDATGGVEITVNQEVDVAKWGGVGVNPLIAGRVDASVGAMEAGVVSAAAIATGAVDADALATDAVDEIVDAVWNEAQSGHTTAGTFGKRLDVDASSRAAPGDAMDLVVDAVDSAAVAASAVTEIQSGLATAAAVAALPTAAVNADAVWDEARAGHVAGGSFGEGVASVQGNVTGSAASVTGAVGSVTGAAGSVTGSVGSVAAGGITSSSFAAGAVTASALAADAVDEIIDEPVEGSVTLRQAIRALLAYTAAKVSGGGTTTIVYRDLADTKNRITLTVDASGNRSAVVINDLT